jgi:SHS2 domain-containing protein
MGYRFREDLTSADAAFEASGADLSELFRSSAQALLELMVENPESLGVSESRELELGSGSLPDLLHDFLQKIVFWKDSEQLFLAAKRVEIGGYRLHAVFQGEKIDPTRQSLGTDVKAVTYHQLRVWKAGSLWKATVVVDT